MKKTLLLALSVLCATYETFAGAIPPELIGEWVSPQTKFKNQAVAKGDVIYINTNAVAVIIAAPPPIGSEGKADYEPTNKVLTITIGAQPGEGLEHLAVYKFVFDPKSKTLVGCSGVTDKITFKRRRTIVPRSVLEDAQ